MTSVHRVGSGLLSLTDGADGSGVLRELSGLPDGRIGWEPDNGTLPNSLGTGKATGAQDRDSYPTFKIDYAHDVRLLQVNNKYWVEIIWGTYTYKCGYPHGFYGDQPHKALVRRINVFERTGDSLAYIDRFAQRNIIAGDIAEGQPASADSRCFNWPVASLSQENHRLVTLNNGNRFAIVAPRPFVTMPPTDQNGFQFDVFDIQDGEIVHLGTSFYEITSTIQTFSIECVSPDILAFFCVPSRDWSASAWTARGFAENFRILDMSTNSPVEKVAHDEPATTLNSPSDITDGEWIVGRNDSGVIDYYWHRYNGSVSSVNKYYERASFTYNISTGAVTRTGQYYGTYLPYMAINAILPLTPDYESGVLTVGTDYSSSSLTSLGTWVIDAAPWTSGDKMMTFVPQLDDDPTWQSEWNALVTDYNTLSSSRVGLTKRALIDGDYQTYVPSVSRHSNGCFTGMVEKYGLTTSVTIGVFMPDGTEYIGEPITSNQYYRAVDRVNEQIYTSTTFYRVVRNMVLNTISSKYLLYSGDIVYDLYKITFDAPTEHGPLKLNHRDDELGYVSGGAKRLNYHGFNGRHGSRLGSSW